MPSLHFASLTASANAAPAKVPEKPRPSRPAKRSTGTFVPAGICGQVQCGSRCTIGLAGDRFGGRVMFPVVSAVTVLPVLFLGYLGHESLAAIPDHKGVLSPPMIPDFWPAWQAESTSERATGTRRRGNMTAP